MYLCFLKAHNPNNPSPRWKVKSPGGGNYLDSLMELDDNSGQVVQAIRDLGIDQNTLVIWTTDNGAWIDAWPDAGYTPFRGMKGSPSRAASAFRPSPGGGAISRPAQSTWTCGPTWIGGRPFPSSPVSSLRPTIGRTNDGNPIIFDGIDLSESLLGTGPGKHDT